MVLSYRGLGAVVAIVLAVFTQMQDAGVEARRAAFLISGGSTTVGASSSNPGGNTEYYMGEEEFERRGDRKLLSTRDGGGSPPDEAGRKEATGRELMEKADKANEALLQWFESGGESTRTSDDVASCDYQAPEGTHQEPLGTYTDPSASLVKDMFKSAKGPEIPMLGKALAAEFNPRNEIQMFQFKLNDHKHPSYPEVSLANMTSLADGKEKQFIQVVLPADIDVRSADGKSTSTQTCTLNFGFRIRLCSNCCCDKGLLLAETAMKDTNEEGGQSCRDWLVRAQGAATSFANMFYMKHPMVAQKLTQCSEEIENGLACQPARGLCQPDCQQQSAGGRAERSDLLDHAEDIEEVLSIM